MRIVKIDNGITFDNGIIINDDHHDQDCCESVYADFEHLKVYNVVPHTGQKATIFNIDFDEKIEELIQPIKGAGFNLVAKDDSRWFVPCYNEQNGYYSSDLALIIKRNNQEIKIDISDAVEDKIN